MAIPVGSLAFSGFGDAPMVFTDPNGTILTAPPSAPNCGPGCDGIVALVGSGKIGVIGGSVPNFPTTGVGIFAADFSSSVEGAAGIHGSPGRSIARDDNGFFYGVDYVPAILFQYDETGAQTAEWDLSSVVTTVKAIAVNGAGTIAYVNNFASEDTIQAWDLVNDVSLGVFVTEATYRTYDNGILALSNGDVLVGWWKTATNGYVKHYDAAGNLLYTYPIPNGTGHCAPSALTYGLTSASIWCFAYDGLVGVTTGHSLYEIELGTGTFLHAFQPINPPGFEYDGSFAVLLAAISTGNDIIISPLDNGRQYGRVPDYAALAVRTLGRALALVNKTAGDSKAFLARVLSTGRLSLETNGPDWDFEVDGLRAGWLHKSVIVIPHAQILTLPSTPVDTYRSPVGEWYDFCWSLWTLDARLGAYTNLDAAAYAVLATPGEAVNVSSYMYDGGGHTPMTNFWTTANRRISHQLPFNDTDDGELQAPGSTDPDALEDEVIQFIFNNGVSGNLTGGNVANTLTVETWFTRHLL